MLEVLGELLPLAVGVAISPMPIIAVVLMIMSANGRATSTGFLLGWLVGIVAAVTVFTVVTGLLPSPSAAGPNPVKGTIHLVLGLLLVALAVRTWLRRPKAGQPPVLPKWMSAIDSLRLVPAIGLGFGFAAIAPKNLLLAASAGTTIGTASLSGAEVTVAIVVFTVIAASTVLVPVVATLVAGDRLADVLAAVRAWLGRENAVIMAMLLLVLGAVVIGKGIGSF